MSRLKDVFRAERLLPLLAGVAALALVAVVVVIATGGDEAAEPVAEPAAAERAKPSGGGDVDKAESDGRKRQDEEPKQEEQQPEPENPTPQPEPRVPAATNDGEEPDSGAPKDRGSKDKDKADEVSCAEREKATRGDPELERFLDEWFGPCE